MKTIKIKFVDFPYLDGKPETSLIYQLLARVYNIEISENPDYVFSGVLGEEHRKYDNCIKIAQIGENEVPDFNSFDYAIGFDYLNFGDRYLRIPLYAFYGNYAELLNKREFTRKDIDIRSFCSFVVSNNTWGSPLREKFFLELSKYKFVASGGQFLNNIGEPGGVKDKADFCRKYKFNIAFENSSSPGYTTEKIIQPLSWGVVPIYWGNPLITNEINQECFILIRDEDDFKTAIDKIKYLDQNDDAYLSMVNAKPFVSDEQLNYHKSLLEFLVHIFEQPLINAKRINSFGHQAAKNSVYNQIILKYEEEKKRKHIFFSLFSRAKQLIKHILRNNQNKNK